MFAHHVFAILYSPPPPPQVIFVQADITHQPPLFQFPLGAFLYTEQADILDQKIFPPTHSCDSYTLYS